MYELWGSGPNSPYEDNRYLFESEDEGMNETLREKIEILREMVWLEDIPSPCCPEYVEHHESITKILKYIDTELLKRRMKG
jgi:hypothetical protein